MSITIPRAGSESLMVISPNMRPLVLQVEIRAEGEAAAGNGDSDACKGTDVLPALAGLGRPAHLRSLSCTDRCVFKKKLQETATEMMMQWQAADRVTGRPADIVEWHAFMIVLRRQRS